MLILKQETRKITTKYTKLLKCEFDRTQYLFVEENGLWLYKNSEISLLNLNDIDYFAFELISYFKEFQQNMQQGQIGRSKDHPPFTFLCHVNHGGKKWVKFAMTSLLQKFQRCWHVSNLLIMFHFLIGATLPCCSLLTVHKSAGKVRWKLSPIPHPPHTGHRWHGSPRDCDIS